MRLEVAWNFSKLCIAQREIQQAQRIVVEERNRVQIYYFYAEIVKQVTKARNIKTERFKQRDKAINSQTTYF